MHGKHSKLDTSCKEAKSTGLDEFSYNTVYGNDVVDIRDTSITMYKWTFKIISCYNYRMPTCIGLDRSIDNHKRINADFAEKK